MRPPGRSLTAVIVQLADGQPLFAARRCAIGAAAALGIADNGAAY
jgi:hypothetical protein